MKTVTYFSLLFIELHTIPIVAGFVTAVGQRATSCCLNYNVPRKKKDHGSVSTKSYSPFNANRDKSAPLEFLHSEIASSDVSNSNKYHISFALSLTH